jgi:hypothetical protein
MIPSIHALTNSWSAPYLLLITQACSGPAPLLLAQPHSHDLLNQHSTLLPSVDGNGKCWKVQIQASAVITKSTFFVWSNRKYREQRRRLSISTYILYVHTARLAVDTAMLKLR